MKLSISNIGWDAKDDFAVYRIMKKNGFQGIEIAPTRIIPNEPYTRNSEAEVWSKKIKNDYGFCVSSMQSIWYGRQEKLFGSNEERCVLLEYTKRAVDFAVAIGCKNLVFGCPRNRNLSEDADAGVAIDFFKELGDYADSKGTVIGMEANPVIYNTNYINRTIDALELIEQVNSKGFKLNLDIGTVIQNEESISQLAKKVDIINHIHISEPGLKPIKERELHSELKKLLAAEHYCGFISIEMGKVDNIAVLEEKMGYVRKIFG